ncbi:MAG TPA: ABC transporter ATP-binding protein [Marmoricola sp.]|nr:ABC transporter ATP-binding protein [Marmoricola sp.]
MTAPLVFAGVVQRGGFELHAELTVAPGEVVAVLGPNGAGKSTLLRTVAGLERLTSGTVRVGDEIWQDADEHLPPEQRRTGMVFQDHRLFPHLDVRENVAFPLRSSGVRVRAARQEARRWLESLELDHLADRRPGQLSGGQAQRVALARALARRPDVLLLDEPMAALDAGARIDVRAFLRAHLREFPGPVLLVTHDPLEAMVLADRLVVLEDGRVVQEGPPHEVARRPASSYVARLVGLNLWAGVLRGGEVALDGGGTLAVSEGATVEEGHPVLVSLRPSAITLHTERPDHTSTRNVWRGRVAAMEGLADRVRIEVHGTPPALVDVTHAAVTELGVDVGAEVWLSAKATEMEAYAEGAPRRTETTTL